MIDSVEPYAPPADEMAIVEACPIGWLGVLPMMFAVLIAPKRVGPRLAVSSWPKAAAVYLLTTAVAALTFSLSQEAIYYPPSSAPPASMTHATPPRPSGPLQGLTWSEKLCVPAATMIGRAYSETAVPRTPLDLPILTAGVLMVLWPAALLFMPLNASSMRGGKRYLLTLKLTFWSASSLALTGIMVFCALGVIVVCEGVFRPAITQAVAFSIILSWAAAWAVLVAKLGSRVPRRFAPHPETALHLLCNRCGYIVTGLHKESCCPKCGLPVQASLPESRSAPPYAGAHGPLRGFATYWSTLRAAMLRRDFFKRLSLDRRRRGALRFAAWTTVVAGVSSSIAFASFIVEQSDLAATIVEQWLNIGLSLLAIALAGGIGCFAFVLLLVALASRFGARDQRPIMIVTGYASAGLLPAYWAVALVLSVRTVLLLAGQNVKRMCLFGGTHIEPTPWLLTIAFFFAIGMLILGARHIYRAFHDVRFGMG